MSFTPIRDVLPKVLNQKGLKQAAEAALICEKWNKVLKEIFKDKFCDQIKVISFKNGELKVAVLNPSVGQELQLHSSDLIKDLNNLLSSNIVKRVRIVF